MAVIPKWLVVLLGVIASWDLTASFAPIHVTKSKSKKPILGSVRSNTLLRISDSDDFDFVRKNLESMVSKVDTIFPTNSDVAANEAVKSIKKASEEGVGSVFMVDMKLPEYLKGPAFDLLTATGFCMSLAQKLGSNSSLYLRDRKQLSEFSRLQEAKAKEQEEAGVMPDPEPIETEPEDEMVSDRDRAALEASFSKSGPQSPEMEDLEPSKRRKGFDKPEDSDDDVEYYDDFADAADDENISSIFSESDEEDDPEEAKSSETRDDDDTDEYRQELDRINKTKSRKKRPLPQPVPTNKSAPPKRDDGAPSAFRIRVRSLFGDAEVKEGPDMGTRVRDALRANALPEDDEEILIIMFATKPEEVMAVQAMVHKYESTKQIILFNCHFGLYCPQELARAATVYSFQYAGKVRTELDENGDIAMESRKSDPKVSIIRRYPDDWKVYLSKDGGDFELIASTNARAHGQRGPSNEWIAEKIISNM